ncbi:MAG: hypothetical protein WD750_05900 [Gammaproteobacteria bacterium]
MSNSLLELIFLIVLTALLAFCAWRVANEPLLEVITVSDEKQQYMKAADGSPIKTGPVWCFDAASLEEALAEWKRDEIVGAEKIVRDFLHSDTARAHKLIVEVKKKEGQ